MQLWKTFLVVIAMVLSLMSSASATELATQKPTPEEELGPFKQLADVEDWIVSFMRDVAPPGRKVYYPEGQETAEEAEARYKSVARDIIDVVFDSDTKPVFTGKNGRTQTVALILSVMFHESSFMRHVDYGLGKYARGDQGKSWCMMQVFIDDERTMRWNYVKDRPVEWNDPAEEISVGHTGKELVTDRKVCIAEGLRIMRTSFSSCRRLPLEDRMRQYASGSCDKGADASRNRVRTAMRWYDKTYKKQFTDVGVMASKEELWRWRLLGKDLPARFRLPLEVKQPDSSLIL